VVPRLRILSFLLFFVILPFEQCVGILLKQHTLPTIIGPDKGFRRVNATRFLSPPNLPFPAQKQDVNGQPHLAAPC